MRAIIHSIHSQVPATVADLDRRLQLIVSLDSHLDVSLGGDDSLYPKELQTIARRTGAHTAFRHPGVALTQAKATDGGSPRLVVAVPERMLAAHATDIESQMPPALRIHDLRRSIASSTDFLESAMGIEVYQSPPETLLGLVGLTRTTGEWILDIDVDYMHEMQRECYTRVFRPGPGVLQSMSNVADFVRRTRPETITISEAKVAAIRDPKSSFSNFIAGLRAMGYHVEERGVFESDAEVLKGISLCNEFYRTVSKVLTARHMREMMQGDFDGFREEEAKAAREFFGARGYSY